MEKSTSEGNGTHNVEEQWERMKQIIHNAAASTVDSERRIKTK